MPLTQFIAGWRAEPAIALGQALDLVQQLLQATGELEQLRPSRFPLSPVQVFAVRDEAGKQRWIVLPLPLEGAAFADFIRADEDCWAWLSADELLGELRTDRAYTIGAALYYCLIASLFPPYITRAERARRLLLYRAGSPEQARRALEHALPDAQAAIAHRLFEFIMGLLAPSLGRNLTTAQASRELDRFCEELSPHRLACLWELASAEQGPGSYIHRARANIETLVATVPDHEVPWDAVERLREKDGDHAGAAEAAARHHNFFAESSFITHVRSLVEAGDERRPELARLMEMAREMAGAERAPQHGARQQSRETAIVMSDPIAEPKAGTPQLTEEQFLYLTYVQGRWLTQPDEALLWLERDFAISWNKVVRSVLAGRLLAGREDWIRVAGCCRNGRRLVAQMSDSGGEHGRYASGYLDMLDGIAHICAVHRQGHAHDYLTDAFNRLQSAWTALQQVAAADLCEAIVAWLSRLGELCSHNPQLTTQCLGIEAFLESMGVIAGQGRPVGLPPIPWFDESRLFIS